MASHRRTNRQAVTAAPLLRAATGMVAATAAAFASTPSGHAAPAPAGEDPAARLSKLYAQAESATEKYNRAAERRQKLEERIGALSDQVARGRDKLNRMRRGLGALAGAQYRSGAVDPALVLLLSSDPDHYLERASTLDRIGSLRTGQVRRLLHTQRSVDQRRAEAVKYLGELRKAEAELARHKKAVRSKLAQARRLLVALPAQQRAAPGPVAPRPAPGHAHRVQPSARPVPAGSLPAPSARAALAVAAAQRALGAPYRWGSAGPYAFDCSGLTYWAYRQAGVTLPRTSQGQMHAGRRVSLADARPGDLVVYREDASHVAMYMGAGQVVHAPYPGASVRYDPVDMMPIAAVTRI